MKRISALTISLFFISWVIQAQPTLNPTGFAVTGFTNNSLTVTWANQTDAQRTNYLILANTTGTFTDPANSVNQLDDADLSDGVGVINLADNETTYIWNTGLSAATVYYFKIFAYKQPSGPSYLITGAPTANRTTLAAEPTANPSGLAVSNLASTSATLTWNTVGTPAGSGTDRIVIVNPNSGSFVPPVDGTTYSAIQAYGSGGTTGAGNFVVYKGTGTTVNITGLTPNVSYKFSVVSFNGTGTAENYFGSGASASQTTLPSITSVTFSTPAANNPIPVGTATVTITVADDQSLTHTLTSGTVGGYTLTNLQRTSSTTYTADITITNGGTDIPAINNITVSNLVLNNGTSANAAYSQDIIQPNDKLDANLPTVISSNYFNPAGSPTNATSLVFQVIFSESVTGVGAGNFSATLTGGVTADAITTVTGSGTTYNVTVPNVGGATTGTVRLDVGNVPSITDGANLFNGSFAAGQVYAIDKVAPGFSGTAPATNAFVNNKKVSYTLSEEIASGTITWTGTGGGDLSAHAQTLNFGAGELTIGDHLNITLNSSPSLVNGATYDIKFEGTDAAGNSATPVINTSITYDVTAPTTQNTVYASSSAVIGGGSVTIVSSGDVNNSVWFAPSGTLVFAAGATMTKAATGTSVTILAPATSGDYKLFVVDQAGNISTGSTATLTVVNPPATPASAIVFSNVTETSMTVSWTNGNGTRRLVIVRQGGSVVTDPTNFTSYTASSDWNSGSPTGTAIGLGFVAYDGTGNSFTITNLDEPGTYGFGVYEYEGTSTLTGAFNTTQPIASQAVIVQATAIALSNPGSTTFTLGWANGTGTNRIAIVKPTGTSFTPANGATGSYTSSPNYGSTSDLNGVTGVRCVWNSAADGSGTSVNITNLIANTDYTYQVYEYTGTGATLVYNQVSTAANSINRTTIHATQPPNEATAAGFSLITANSITYQVTALGTTPGASRMIVVSDAAISFDPTDGTSYTFNPDVTLGTDLDGTPSGGTNFVKVVGYGSGAIAVTGLTIDKTYFFAAFEFNGAQGTGAENYRNTEFETSRNTEPSSAATALNFTGISTTGLTLNWTNGNGDRRIVLAHQGGPVDLDPSDLTTYVPNGDWNSNSTPAGALIGVGNYVVFDGTGNSAPVTELLPNTVYHFTVYEYNGAGTLTAAYLIPGTSASRTTLATAPTSASTGIAFTNITNNSITVGKTSGAGTGTLRMLVARPGSAVNFTPSDGVSYNSQFNANYTLATEVGTPTDGNKIVGLSNNGTFNVTGLSGDQIYHFEIFEFNGAIGSGAENYLTSASLTGSRNTAPTVQANTLTFAAANVSNITLSWTNGGAGNGDRRLVLIRQGSAVNAIPSELTTYAPTSNWATRGGTNNQVGSGNYVVYDGNGNSTGVISNLQANTTYHFAIFEYNSYVGGSVQNSTLSGAFLNATTAIANQTTSVDASGPAAIALGALTSKGGGIEVAGYWNIVNDSIQVVIPLGATNQADPTLDLGKVQLQLKQSSPSSTSFTNISGALDALGSGLSTITNAQRVAGTKTMYVRRANLLAHPDFDDGATFQITAVITDFSNNPATVTPSATNMKRDETRPTITDADFYTSYNQDTDASFTTCRTPSPIAPDHVNGTAREYVHLTISEPLNITNGDLPSIVSASTSYGFNASGYNASWAGTSYATFDQVCDSRGGTAYHPTNVIHLQADYLVGPSTDGLWTNSTEFSFTSGGSNVKDMAGNEMASLATIFTAATPPKLASSMVLNPDPTGANTPEKITFSLDQLLTTSTTADAVVGITVDRDGSGVLYAPVAALGTYNTSGNTVTVTSPGDGQWTEATTVSYTTGAVGPTKLNTTVAVASFGPEQVLLGPVIITSSNATNSLAKEGNTIYVTVTANPGALPLSGTPFSAATIAGIDVLSSQSGSNPYTFSLVTSGATPVPETSIAFSVTAEQAGRTTTIAKTVPGTTVTYDKTIPTKPAAPDLAAADDTGPGPGANTDNYTKTNTDLTFSGTVNNSSTIGLTATVTIFKDGGSIGTTPTDAGGNWTYEAYQNPATLADGTYSFTVQVTDAAGNQSLVSDPLVITIDNTPPTVVSILRINPPVLNSWSTTNGTSATTVTYRVTFDENVTGFDYSGGGGGGGSSTFTRNTTGDVSTSGFSGALSTATNFVDVTVSGISGTGKLSLNFLDKDNVVNLVGDPVGGAGNGNGNFTSDFSPLNEYYTIVLPQPTASVTGFTSSSTATSLTVNWTHASAPATQATHYLVRLKKTTSAFSPVTFTEGVPGGTAGNDGVDFTDTDFTDGTLAAYVTYPSSGHTFNGITSGIPYNIEIYPLTQTSNYGTDNWDYRFTGPLTGNPSTISSPNTALNVVSAATSFASTATYLAGAVVPQSNAAQNFVFTIQDDGASPTADDAPFRFSTIVIKQGTGSGAPITDWTQAIDSARLSDGTTFVDVGSPAITSNQITFTVNPATLGFIGDDATKTYTLKIALKTSLGGTLQTDVDGKNFEFKVDGTCFTYFNTGQTSSTIIATGGTSTIESGDATNQVAVSATAIAFNTQPAPSPVLVLTNFTTAPIARAVDANGNVDRGYSPSAPGVIITNTDAIGMSTTSIVPVNGIISFPANFQYQGDGNGKLTLTGGGINSNSGPGFVACSAVTVQYSSASTITANVLANAIESNKVTQGAADAVFRFNVLDDGGSGGDGAPTRISQIVIAQGPINPSAPPTTNILWKNVILGAVLSDNATPTPNTIHLDSTAFASAATNTSITFSGIANTLTTDMGYIANDQTKIYTLSIYLKKAQVTPTTIDGQNLIFQVANTNLSVPLASSTFASTSTTSGATNNVIDVVATKLAFINQPASTLLVSKAISLQPPIPSLQATDAYGNRDLNYVTDLNITNAGGLQMSTTTPVQGPAASIVLSGTGANGLYTFPGNFLYNQIGNGKLIATPASGTVTLAQSNAVTVQVATSTRINSPSVSAASITSITNVSPGSTVFTFVIQDDAGAETDGNPTLITEMLFTPSSLNNNITDWSQAILGARVEDNADPTKFIDILPTNILSNSLRFTGISTVAGALGRITDDAPKTFNLRIWLKPNLSGANNYRNTIDGLKFGFDLTSTNVTVDPNGTALIASLNANTTNVTTTVAVAASQLHITTPSSASFASLSSPFPVVVQARDINLNLDLDFEAGAGIITSVTNTTNATMIGTGGITIGTAGSGITFNTTSFTDGIFTFPALFQYTTGNNLENVTLSITAGGISTVPVSPGPAPFTPTITLQTSSESAIVGDPTFGFITDIPYHNFPEATDLTAANSYTLSRALLVDGSRVGFAYSSTFGSGTLTTNTNNDGQANVDTDGASTNLNSITLRITNPANIRRIALFTNGGAQIGPEIGVNELKSVTSKDFVFSGSPLLTALNDSESEIRIGVSFWNDSTHVTDNKLIQVSVVAAVLGNGSKFFPDPANAAYIGGVDGGVVGVTDVGLAAPANVNFIEVTATSLDFVKQPNDFAGINQPIDATTASSTPYTAIVHARDKFAVVDLDFNFTPSVSASATPVSSSTPFGFNNGVLDLKFLQYTNAGAGKLTVSTSSPNPILNSNNTPWATSIVCETVDVINVTAAENINGVLTTPNLKGGNVNQVIFGFTLNAQHRTASEPKLKGFSITFKDDNGNPYFYKTASSTVLKNFKILESTQGTAAGATSIAGIATIAPARSPKAISLYGPSATSFDMVTVTFNPSANYRTLFDPANPLTYYLQVDVDVSTNIGTPAITPYLEDNGYSDIFTRDGVILTEGSSKITPVVKGATRSFASTKPPELVSSSPFNGQLNVDTLLNTITLFFDVPVTTFDGKAYLYDRYSNTRVATLTATNGIYQWSTGQPISPSPYITNPLTFQLPSNFDLKPDSVYYLTIDQGRFDPNNPVDRAGLSDDGFNLFGGISFNGTLYFKAASKKPPVMKGSDPLKYYFSKTTTTINASFNQRGTAYFMVTATNPTTPPTNAQIKGATYSGGTIIGRGSIDVAQIEPSYQYGTINTGLTPGTTYDVFMYAENDALPNHIATSAPYGSSGNLFVAGTAGPTLRFTAPPLTTALTNFPRYQICSNSYTQLSDPIIISEVTNNEFSGGAGVVQSLNLLLPTGFQFDVNAPISVQFNGADFDDSKFLPTALPVPLPHYEFINTTILKISFVNNGTTFDNIIISDLVVIASAPDITGFITRFSGNGITAISDGAQFAQITSASDDPINFTNSYSNVGDFDQVPISIANTVTYIPDNYVDVTLNQSATRLFPKAPTGDYGPTFFSGSGLTNDILNLTAVPLNTGFNITLSHTDMNGCISTKSDQYTVYNHKNAIATLGTPSVLTGERQVCIRNQNFPAVSTNQVILSDSVSADGLAGYKLIQLFANIPTKATASSQIIYGAAWQALVQQIPKVYSAKLDANTGQTYRTYNWDYKPVLNANTLTAGGIPNPYNNFVQPPTPLGKTYYKGGSLGLIEFTGKYHSKADFSVFIPVRQEVEVFIPAIPVVEQVTTPSYVTSAGTLIYCEGIGSASDILINGYPAASPGSSTGSFTLRDSANLTLVTIPSGGFTDNGNGTSLLKSSVINNYRTIRVDYTYQDNGSPCSATGSFFIRITPNPRANFSATSVLASAQPIDLGRPSTTNAYCENNLIQFDNTSTFPAVGYVANRSPRWTLGDPLSATNTQLTPSATFTYTANGRYIVTFSIQSQYGCASQVFSDSIYVGALPNVSFSMNGISTATPLKVVDNSTVADGPGTNSDIFSAQWKYSPSNVFTGVATNTFTTPGHYTITLKSTTQISDTDPGGNTLPLPGCERTIARDVIIVPDVNAAAVGTEVKDDFESADPLKQWQKSNTNNLVSSWQRGDATESSSIELTSNVWATGLATLYNPGEVSFLYSPSYDLSNLLRPKVSFDFVAYMEVNDGVVLEFSTDTFNIADPLKKWYRVGTNVDGNNWYNRSGLASKPGTQLNIVTGISSGDYGWSAQLDTVLHAQHTLSPDIPAGKRTHVVFRFALASLSGSSSQGFALDNFRVGERTRVVLVENFTNIGNANSVNGLNIEKRESDFLKGDSFKGVGTDIVKINYHVGFPNLDPFNDDYPADPSARALYYNISETPLTRMDGGKSNDPQKKYFSDWGVGMYNIRTLKLAQADLQITNPTPSANGGFEFSVSVTAKSVLAKDETILHVAFVEALIPFSSLKSADQGIIATGESTFEYVLKEMVPSALGTKFKTSMVLGESKTFGPFEWNPDLGKLYNAKNDLAIVVFLQNEITREIYQAEILTGITDPAIVTNVEDPDYTTKIQLFPNPANNEVNIQLPAAVSKSTPVEMFDTYGKSVYQSSFKAGEQIKTVSTTELTGGVYFIQLITPDGNIARRKVMVVHH